jgi:hypothetical protein
MRALLLAYRGAERIVPQLVGQVSETGLPLAVAEFPWGQNVVLIEPIKNLRERLWYARATFEHGWSRPSRSLDDSDRNHVRASPYGLASVPGF